MEIKSVKFQGEGYLLNNEMYVPKADGNREYELIKEWLKDNTPEPEFTDEELKKQEILINISNYNTYLSSTDWYVTRLTETQKPIPDDVLAKRNEAREYISNNKGE